MKVKVRIKDVLHRTSKATLFLISEREVWLPNAAFKFGRGNFIITSETLAKEKGVKYDSFFHTPDKIEPEYNQQAIDELKL